MTILDNDFLAEFKRATEAQWSRKSLDPSLYGFQFQRGTRCNPGLPNEKIAEYEHTLGVRFPHDFRALLIAMNGTDLPTLNVYGSRGHTPPHQSVGVYAYPRDVDVVKQRIEDLRGHRAQAAAALAEQGFDLIPEAQPVPIYIHRYVVCTPDLDSSVVLSVHGADAIVYGYSLREYLGREFLGARGRPQRA